jgi:hypothetical protein
MRRPLTLAFVISISILPVRLLNRPAVPSRRAALNRRAASRRAVPQIHASSTATVATITSTVDAAKSLPTKLFLTLQARKRAAPYAYRSACRVAAKVALVSLRVARFLAAARFVMTGSAAYRSSFDSPETAIFLSPTLVLEIAECLSVIQRKPGRGEFPAGFLSALS